MPELPEVETTKRGIEPYLIDAAVQQVVTRIDKLRWPIPSNLNAKLSGQRLLKISRRAKYLLLHFKTGTLILHLGMSGKLAILSHRELVKKHDHFDLIFDNNYLLRLNDPRRFGCILFTQEDPLQHPLLLHLGPEPLTRELNAKYLQQTAASRKVSIKQFVMDNKVVVGVGNIYAQEALFAVGIDPRRAANSLISEEWQALCKAIKNILKLAIKQGGTTLRDFASPDGDLGYFVQSLKVYGRAGQACFSCDEALLEIKQGQRTTTFCETCQN